MSMVDEKVTDETAAPDDPIEDPLEYSAAEMKKRRPSGKKVYKPHLATKIKWALEDSMLGTQEAQKRMLTILDLMDEARGMKGDDARWLVHLGKIDHEIAHLALVVSQLERTVTQAIHESKPGKTTK